MTTLPSLYPSPSYLLNVKVFDDENENVYDVRYNKDRIKASGTKFQKSNLFE